jgi:hypothetical protein
MRKQLIVLSMLSCLVAGIPAQADVGIDVNIGVNLPAFPDLTPIPGYPAYYAPGLDTNYFFYDGMYWVYQDDNWYASSWYNGPWDVVAPDFVPVFVLRIPVRYYRRAPVYFHGWRQDAAPRWDQHWGHDWAEHRHGWDQWNHHSVPPRPPLPVYQRQYSGDKYPHVVQQQQTLQDKNYRYKPHDPLVRQQHDAQHMQKALSSQGGAPQPRANEHRNASPAAQQATPAPRPPESRKDHPSTAQAVLPQDQKPRATEDRRPHEQRPSAQPNMPAAPHEQAPHAPDQPPSPPAHHREDRRPIEAPAPQNIPHEQAPQRERPAEPQHHEPAAVSHDQAPGPQGNKGGPEPRHEQKQERDKERDKGDDHGDDHKK